MLRAPVPVPLALTLYCLSACGGRSPADVGPRDASGPQDAEPDLRDGPQPDLHDAAGPDLLDVFVPLLDAALPDVQDAGASDLDAACDPGVVVEVPSIDNHHEATGNPVVYDHEPPCIGPHWAEAGVAPAPNGEYAIALEPERYIHNLEHGAIAFLYDPGAPVSDIDALRDYATMRPDDDGGTFRWVLTPRPGMPSVISVVAWGWIQRLDMSDVVAIDCFVDVHYRQAPEDFPTP